MSAAYYDHGNMSDHRNSMDEEARDSAASTVSNGNISSAVPASGKASFDDKATLAMFLILCETRTFTGAESEMVASRMQEQGYSYTAKQIYNRYHNIRSKGALGTKLKGSASITTINASGKAKPKATLKLRAKKEPALDANGNPKPRPKTRKTAVKKEPNLDEHGNPIEVDGPPAKKRKAAGTMASKKVIHEIVPEVKDEEEEQGQGQENAEGGAGMMDAEASYAVGVETESDANVEAQAAELKADADFDAQEETKSHTNGNDTAEVDYDARQGEEDISRFEVAMKATKVDTVQEQADPNQQLVTETMQFGAYSVVQAST